MPPKGWRKNADGTYPVPNKEHELISIDDILFPRTTVNKLAKTVLSEQNSLSKDSVIALQRSATVFVSHLMFYARNISKEQDRKTVNAQDILNALERTEFSSFIPVVKRELELFNVNKQNKKKEKENGKQSSESNTNRDGGNEDDGDGDSSDDGDEEDGSKSQGSKKLKNNSGKKIVNSPKNQENEDDLDEAEDENFNDAEEDSNNEDERPYVEPLSTLEQDELELKGEDHGDEADNEDTRSDDEEDD